MYAGPGSLSVAFIYLFIFLFTFVLACKKKKKASTNVPVFNIFAILCSRGFARMPSDMKIRQVNGEGCLRISKKSGEVVCLLWCMIMVRMVSFCFDLEVSFYRCFVICRR